MLNIHTLLSRFLCWAWILAALKEILETMCMLTSVFTILVVRLDFKDFKKLFE